MSDKPKVIPDIEVRTVDEEKVVLNRDGEHIHQLNETASFVWDRCDGKHEIGEIADELATVYGVDSKQTLQDVSDVVLQFSQLGLLEGAAGESGAS